MTRTPPCTKVFEAMLVACGVCSAPATLMALGHRPGSAFMSFVVLSLIHVFFFGLPAFWILWRGQLANALSCAIAGALIGTLPYAAFFAPHISGPGVRLGQTILLLGLSGAAIGFVFWMYLTWRVGDDEEGWRRARTTEELLRWAAEPALREHDARQIRDLQIRVAADASAPDAFLVTVRNSGRVAYEELAIDIRDVLFAAESFSLDTTHMPAQHQYIDGESIVVGRLGAGESACFVRRGYDTHERYDGGRKRVLNVTYMQQGKPLTAADRRWTEALVDLPNARSSG